MAGAADRRRDGSSRGDAPSDPSAPPQAWVMQHGMQRLRRDDPRGYRRLQWTMRLVIVAFFVLLAVVLLTN
jgi:hypothetical protein